MVHAHLFIIGTTINVQEETGLIAELVKRNPYPLPTVFVSFLYIIIILLQSLRLNVLLNDLKMYNDAGFTTALAYVLLTALIPQWSNFSTAIIANTFVIWVYIFLSKLYNNPKPKAALFNTGLAVGISFLCYYPTFILIAVAFFALAVVRPFRLSEWIILLLGIIMPIYVFVSIVYLNDKLFVLVHLLPKIQLHMPVGHSDIWLTSKLIFVVIMLVIGLNFWNIQNGRMIIQLRKNWAAMIVLLFITLPIPFIFSKSGMESAVLCLVPLASFIGNAFLYPKKQLLPNLLFFVCLALIVHTNWWLIRHQ